MALAVDLPITALEYLANVRALDVVQALVGELAGREAVGGQRHRGREIERLRIGFD